MIRNTIGLTIYFFGIIFSVGAISFFVKTRLLSGEVKLHISSSRNKIVEIILLVFWLALGILTFATAEIFVDFIEGFSWIGFAAVNLFVVKSGIDIRERGIFYYGDLISWEAIESAAWEKDENTNRLKIIRRKSFLSFSKEINLIVPTEKVKDADTLLNKYFHNKGLV